MHRTIEAADRQKHIKTRPLRLSPSAVVAARTDLCLWIGAFGIPRDDKRYRGGEDAWFLDAERNSFGVADGVSEWEDLAGINPQDYAQDLMEGTQEAIDNIQKEQQEREREKQGNPNANDDEELSPADIAREALTRAYHRARNFGSSTAIVGVLDGKSGVFGAHFSAVRPPIHLPVVRCIALLGLRSLGGCSVCQAPPAVPGCCVNCRSSEFGRQQQPGAAEAKEEGGSGPAERREESQRDAARVQHPLPIRPPSSTRRMGPTPTEGTPSAPDFLL